MRPRDADHSGERGCWPSVAEEVQALHLDWVIERELTEAGHGDWLAIHRDDENRVLRAPDIEALRDVLRRADASP
ncbi:hypothetical protein [Bailinhaonella thermotolerans]|uniref:hypothetical protein n=1 Tax=Bailinhaonella thermotolerans TaxID=1070861 RepID=UPI000E752576|nr:hypothetical protein [Bailinhaonella thermotolerans]